MIKLGKEWNINSENIQYYCNHRNECLSMVSSDRKIAKTAYLKVAYGGNIKLHSEYYNDDGIAPDGDLIVFFNKVKYYFKSICFLCVKNQIILFLYLYGA